MTAVIEARGLTIRAGQAILVDDVTLRVGQGETIALVGPNGAGKSSLLRALSGEIAPAAGQIRLKNKPLASYGPRALALERAVLAQSIEVAFPFTVAEVARMGAGDRRGPFVGEAVETALQQVDIANLRDRVITTLSGGEQQRAHFARILVQLACGESERGPGLLLLDEPTSSLDLRHQLDLLGVVKQCAARGIAVIAVLHDLNLASMFADRIVMLQRGRIAADGPVAQTITDSMLQRVFDVTGAVSRTPPAGIPFVLPHGIGAG
ncbi:MAG TPA: heme ABC transporter ATP-binding protein [Pseudorhodoplanes sp.]|nr:heme ABC transporter ATP-binding protein [Pseudorhodoplanes sp.]